MVERREQPTIMDGKVVTFAEGFDEFEGVFGPHHTAKGPFEISASRNAVIVHRAECSSHAQIVALLEAVAQAGNIAQLMARDDRGNFAPPDYLAAKPEAK
jgi:hypothetical protein